MNITHLEYYVALVANDFNITKTSQKLYVSQPALSRIINSLETLYDVELFIRHNRRIIKLTPLGEEVYEIALKILKYDSTLTKRLEKVSQKEVIKIGIPASFLATALSSVIVKFIARNPQLQIAIVEENVTILEEKLVNQQIDIAFLISPKEKNFHQGIESLPFYDDEIVVYMKKDHRFNSRTRTQISLEEINMERLCILDNKFLMNSQIYKHFSSENLTPKVALETSSWEFLIDYCNHFGALTMLPASLYPIIPDNEQFVHMSMNPPLKLPICLCYYKDNATKIDSAKKSLLDIIQFETT
ncbi:LysR family transcriptional regulator [Lactococcus sp. DD01]|uniref:LysR family transcriptional regulator n=1 Tax=Lactococcus sp. DD01 TaxID=1776443 RepID=UPI0007760719|nr:LysR family transcriptional regulator [Lactococcus sp. DD01]KXT59431.1 Transcriptional regulator, LysR family [Lactococcus sp. DD01]